MSTKVHAAVDALGNPLRFILTGGQAHESKQAEALIDGFDFDKFLGDKGFDSDRFRATIAASGAEAVIPPIGSRKEAIAYDERIATRYEKTAISFAAMLAPVGAMIWLR